MGCLEILNVQGGEVKITFDNKDAPEAIRARRIIGEMIRSGFVLLVEVERNGDKRFERALSFDEARGEYVIADYEGAAPPPAMNGVPANGANRVDPPPDPPPDPPAARKGRPRKRVPMEEAEATAVGPSAGG